MANATVIVPCGGKSSRFPGIRPKWMLNTPNGNLMVIEALKGLPMDQAKRVIITILKEHQEKYNIVQGIIDNYVEVFGRTPEICILDKPTSSQSETIVETLKRMNVIGPFYVKDSDNYFEVEDLKASRCVTVENINDYENINPMNKSYVTYDPITGIIDDIFEKKIKSDMFSIGGYGFTSAKYFIQTYESLVKYSEGEVYISDVISSLLSEGTVFTLKRAKNYKDWGTLKDWLNYKSEIGVYFVDIDGVLFKNGAQYFEPKWGTTKPIIENIMAINQLYEQGNQIIITTSRKESFREVTERQFKEYGLKYHSMLMGIYHGKRTIINDFAGSNPYPSAKAINLIRDDENLTDYLNV